MCGLTIQPIINIFLHFPTLFFFFTWMAIPTKTTKLSLRKKSLIANTTIQRQTLQTVALWWRYVTWSTIANEWMILMCSGAIFNVLSDLEERTIKNQNTPITQISLAADKVHLAKTFSPQSWEYYSSIFIFNYMHIAINLYLFLKI